MDDVKCGKSLGGLGSAGEGIDTRQGRGFTTQGVKEAFQHFRGPVDFDIHT
jgi:hypothetical protein